MFTSGNTSPCHHSLHLFVKTDESQQAGIVQKLSDQALNKRLYYKYRLFLLSFRIHVCQSMRPEGFFYGQVRMPCRSQ
ncbi:hypothetical protein CFR80_17320 [Komagataeibacter oboediens]|uniref:Uncharacterized protein n=1 Tax=Komagataeibacter oboediens TaxID=65958 RepID=A0A318QIT7_9PROT|nr:hypothetical protein CFR80_17320 [Komagataeibacter oboediens]